LSRLDKFRRRKTPLEKGYVCLSVAIDKKRIGQKPEKSVDEVVTVSEELEYRNKVSPFAIG